MTQLNIENSSQAIKIKIKPNTHPIYKKSSNQEINLRELNPKKHLSDLGQKVSEWPKWCKVITNVSNDLGVYLMG